MTKKYDGEHFQAETVNLTDGTVEGHAQGCADLTRKTSNHADLPVLWDCNSKEEVREGYNADFDEETDGWYDIDWKPCANHIPDTVLVEEPGSDFAVDGVVVKVGRKWTYMYLDGVLIAEVLNEQAETVRRALLHI